MGIYDLFPRIRCSLSKNMVEFMQLVCVSTDLVFLWSEKTKQLNYVSQNFI